ncbi:hypothetical protein vBPaeSS218_00055 [Pseudomonas phage vB_PaeS_S218]|nr:hypothetical protein vBPaeSS218_00055 [Pseudomonas phage vB_PaeS_S218]
MSLILPPQTHAARELIDMEQLASLGDVQNRMKLPTLQQAKTSAARSFAGDRAIRRINMLVLRADGSLELIGFGPRGGRQTLWKFGQP